jgi:hypothetical protein
MVNMKKYSQTSFVVIGFDMKKNSLKIDYSDWSWFSEKLILKMVSECGNRIQTINGILTFLKPIKVSKLKF